MREGAEFGDDSAIELPIDYGLAERLADHIEAERRENQDHATGYNFRNLNQLACPLEGYPK